MNHVLKTHSDHFEKVWEWRKPFEVRIDDRDPAFAEGDTLFLQEWDARVGQELPRWISARVTCVVHGPTYGLADGYCVLGMDSPLFVYGAWSKSERAAGLRVFSRTKAALRKVGA